MTAGTPPAEVDVKEALVRRLLAEQHPDLAELRLRRQSNGWDNVMFRLGDDLLLRLPRREAALGMIRNEQAWLPRLAPALPLPIPAPVRTGAPGCGYPWPWSIVTWIEGRTAAVEPPVRTESACLARFLDALHAQSVPLDAPRNPVRGVPLRNRAPGLEERLDRIEASGSLRSLWRDLVQVPIDCPDAWIHGDLHPKNVIVDGGRLAAVIDWGNIAAGDRATDLASLWMLFDTPAHAAFWNAYGPATAATRQRARGWALVFGVILLDTGIGDHDPAFTRIGRETLSRVSRE